VPSGPMSISSPSGSSGTLSRRAPNFAALNKKECGSSQAEMCRQKAAEAKQSAAKAKNPFIKRAFEELAAAWRILAEQMEWTDRQKSPLNDEESSD
jgi:hypothetical protein